MAAKRRPVRNKRGDRKMFSYSAERTKKKNISKTNHRGGIRL